LLHLLAVFVLLIVVTAVEIPYKMILGSLVIVTGLDDFVLLSFKKDKRM